MTRHHIVKTPQQANHAVDTYALARLYPQSSDYLWLHQQKPGARTYDALEFIGRSVNHGLDPNDYHQDLLLQLDPTRNKSDAHLFDLMLTDGLLKLIHDLSTGRLDPTVVDPEWSIPRPLFDATAFLQQALSSDHFKACLLSLIPTSVQYRKLKIAAARYQAYVGRGGWATITGVPELRAGASHKNIPAIRHRLAIEDELLEPVDLDQQNRYGEKLEQAVKRFQRRHSLTVDGIIGPATIRALNISAEDRLQQISINLERLRWLPDDLGKRYIMINIANYRLTAVEDNKVKLDMRVIVGKAKRPTPSFSSKLTYIVYNPRWYVPHKLARLDLLPKQQKNPDFFNHENIRVYNLVNGIKVERDPDSIDWHTLTRRHFPYQLVQDPGKKNALGRLKFILPNPWNIYMHDTPSKYLFSQNERNFSSGCIRVEDPFALAKFSLGGTPILQPLVDEDKGNISHRTKLNNPLSVYAVYSTVWPDGDEIIFSPDSYQRDQKMAQYL